MQGLVTIKVDLEKYNEIREYYSPFFVPIEGEYIDFVANTNGVIITGYISGKGKKSVVFRGALAEEEVARWKEIEIKKPKEKEKLHYVDFGEQIGSDEVGVGDFFLPIVVAAVYMRNDQYQRLKELGVTDSKKLTDKRIRELGPILMEEFDNSIVLLPNSKYNEVIAKGENLNSIKAKMHNRVLLNLHKKYIDVIAIYVDQFVSEEKYYEYLEGGKDEIVKGISFKTKGEQRFPCVAAASVIARYYFLKRKDELEKQYEIEFPFGAGKKVDEFKKEFIERFGENSYKSLVKQNFKNYSSN
jgi:ribonuclease HIII